MKKIMIDTSFFYALIDKKDKNHNPAKLFLKNNKFPLITTSYIFDELITIIRYDFGHGLAVNIGEKINASELCYVLQISEDDLRAAWETFCEYDDQDFSYTDCTTFALMKRLKIKEVASFDCHFDVIGFTNLVYETV